MLILILICMELELRGQKKMSAISGGWATTR